MDFRFFFSNGKMFHETCRNLVGGKACFLVNAGKGSRKQASGVCTVMFPPGSILRWQEPVTITAFALCIWVLLLVSSAVVVFICEPCFF